MPNWKNQPTPVIAFVAARSGTGKTTFLEKLIASVIRQGYSVATAKHVHHADLDVQRKDSARHRAAGAAATAVIGTNEYVIIGPTPANPTDVLAHLPLVDLVFAEGFRGVSLPKIEIVRSELGTDVVTPPTDLIAIVTDVPDLQVEVPTFPLDDPDLLTNWLCQDLRVASPASQGGVSGLTHFDGSGRPRMVDVGNKAPTVRTATAAGEVRMQPSTLAKIRHGELGKGDVLAVAQVAAIMAVKETPRLIPMCHPLAVSAVDVRFHLDDASNMVEITVQVKLTGPTGVEMEALTGVSIAALTVYDMCKAVDKTMEIGNIRLLEKTGGRSGHFRREELPNG